MKTNPLSIVRLAISLLIVYAIMSLNSTKMLQFGSKNIISYDDQIYTSKAASSGNKPITQPKPNNQKDANQNTDEADDSFVYSGNMLLTLKADYPYVEVNGILMELDPGRNTTPVTINGRTLLPLSLIIPILGGDVGFNSAENKVRILLNKSTIDMQINNRAVVINGKNYLLDVPPQVINQRTMVPIRFIAENCNLSIEWKNPEVVLRADYLPEGIQKARSFFNKSLRLDNMTKLPSVINIFSKLY